MRIWQKLLPNNWYNKMSTEGLKPLPDRQPYRRVKPTMTLAQAKEYGRKAARRGASTDVCNYKDQDKVDAWMEGFREEKRLKKGVFA